MKPIKQNHIKEKQIKRQERRARYDLALEGVRTLFILLFWAPVILLATPFIWPILLILNFYTVSNYRWHRAYRTAWEDWAAVLGFRW